MKRLVALIGLITIVGMAFALPDDTVFNKLPWVRPSPQVLIGTLKPMPQVEVKKSSPVASSFGPSFSPILWRAAGMSELARRLSMKEVLLDPK